MTGKVSLGHEPEFRPRKRDAAVNYVVIPHASAMQEALPNAQLAVLPGTTHALAAAKPALVNAMLLDFPQPEQAKKLFKMG